MRKKGFSLIEVLVAAVILVIVVAGSGIGYVSIRKLSKEIDYRYTALNLAREVLEFGEAGRFAHHFGFKYYYPKAANNTIPESLDCGAGGIKDTVGYAVKEWRCFSLGNADPFDYLGDIKAKGLVPKAAPDSVVIYYKVEADPNFYNEYKQTVEITWQEEQGGKTKKEILSVIPIRHVNDQLRLVTAEFSWD